MSPKQVALRQVGKIVACGLATGILCGLILNYTPMFVLSVVFFVGLFTFLLRMIYDIELSKAEQRARVQDRLDQFSKGA